MRRKVLQYLYGGFFIAIVAGFFVGVMGHPTISIWAVILGIIGMLITSLFLPYRCAQCGKALPPYYAFRHLHCPHCGACPGGRCEDEQHW